MKVSYIVYPFIVFISTYYIGIYVLQLFPSFLDTDQSLNYQGHMIMGIISVVLSISLFVYLTVKDHIK